MQGSRILAAVVMVVAVSCAPSAKPAAADPKPVAKPAVELEEATRPFAAGPPEKPKWAEPASYDFRMVVLDDSVIGTTEKCDVGYVEARSDDLTAPLVVHCLGHRGHASSIALPRTAEMIAALKEQTQIAVRIDGVGAQGTGADAQATLIEVVGELEPPEPPSRCLCREDRDQEYRDSRPKPPAGWDFGEFETEKGRKKYWGTSQICRVSNIGEIARSAATAREYGVGRTFEPETLAFAAKVYCSSGGSVIVGSNSAHSILALDRDQAIRVDLGWVTHGSYAATGRLDGIAYTPERSSD